MYANKIGWSLNFSSLRSSKEKEKTFSFSSTVFSKSSPLTHMESFMGQSSVPAVTELLL